MAYSVDDIGAVESWICASEYADDGSLDITVTACMTNGVTNQDCDEYKEGTINCRVEIEIPPSAITNLDVQFYAEETMTTGTQTLVPYTDENSVSATNKVDADYSSTGWKQHETDASFLAELGDLGDKCAVRLCATGSAKTKISEVNIDITYTQQTLSGVTKDKDGTALGSCEVALFKVISEGPPATYEYIASTTSHATTGAYSFDVWSGQKYFVYSIKEDSPHVFDATDNVLEADT